MTYKNSKIAEIAEILFSKIDTLEDKKQIMRAPELRALYAEIPQLDDSEKAEFGKEINSLRSQLEELFEKHETETIRMDSIDVSAPFDINVDIDKRPRLLTAEYFIIWDLTLKNLDRLMTTTIFSIL